MVLHLVLPTLSKAITGFYKRFLGNRIGAGKRRDDIDRSLTVVSHELHTVLEAFELSHSEITGEVMREIYRKLENAQIAAWTISRLNR